VIMIWTLVLAAIGFAAVSKLKRGTTFVVVFGWYIVFALATTALVPCSLRSADCRSSPLKP